MIAADYIAARPRSRFEATIEDRHGGGRLACVWFNAAWMRFKLTPGLHVRVRGKVRTFRNMPQMANPKWEAIDEEAEETDVDTFRPIYAATADVGSEQIELLLKERIDALAAQLCEWFPEGVVAPATLDGSAGGVPQNPPPRSTGPRRTRRAGGSCTTN